MSKFRSKRTGRVVSEHYAKRHPAMVESFPEKRNDGDAAHPRMVVVSWLDSTSVDYGEWTDIDDELPQLDDLTYRTCGFVVRDDGDVLIVAVGLDREQERACGVLAIPHAAVLAISPLEPARREVNPEADR